MKLTQKLFLVLFLTAFAFQASTTAQTLELHYPNGGEQFLCTDEEYVIWFAEDVGNVKTEYSLDNGTTWTQLLGSTPGGSYAKDWTVPQAWSDECLVKISSVDNPDIYDISDAPFSINWLFLERPVGDENLFNGGEEAITWKSSFAGTVEIYFSEDNMNTWALVADNIQASDGEFMWTAPLTFSTDCYIAIYETAAETPFATSERFTVSSLSLSYPLGGDVFRLGEEVGICYTSAEAYNLKIEYSIDNGEIWNKIDDNVNALSGCYNWVIPDDVQTSNNYLVKVTDMDNPALFDMSEVDFSIVGNGKTMVEWNTNMGTFTAQLREDLVPVTAQNFIDLTRAGFYDGLVFHRVIPDFMIQDGCPWKNGFGDPGYEFDDEFHPDLRHDQPGVLSMANGGPNTNGSQYFITVAPTGWLDDVHAVFGKIVDGYDVVEAISEVPTNGSDRPLEDVVINSISIIEPQPSSVTLLSPVGGEICAADEDFEITWESSFVVNMKIEYSMDNGTTWETATETSNACLRSYNWEVPDVVSSDWLIRISDVDNPEITDQSGATFSTGTIEVTAPGTSVEMQSGRDYIIEWEGENLQSLRIEYTTDIYNWNLIAEDVPAADGSYTWTVPYEATTNGKIKISEMAAPDLSDKSRTFKIFALDLVRPLGGESLMGAHQEKIEWISDGFSELNIDYSLDYGENWIEVATEVDAESQEYIWETPDLLGDPCILKLTHSDYDEIYVQSQVFNIVGLSIEDLQETGLTANCFLSDNLLKINIETQKPEKLQIDLISINGSVVDKIFTSDNVSGKQTISYETSHLEAGIYICRFTTKSGNLDKKIVIAD